jgi:hypothetical protein
MINVPREVFNNYFSAVDYFIEEPMIGKNITLVYESIKPREQNTYLSSFEELDSEKIVSEDTIRVRMYNSPRDWLKTSGIEFIDGRVQIMGYMSDSDKLTRCSYVLYGNFKYKLMSLPTRHGFGEKYFIAYLDLI